MSASGSHYLKTIIVDRFGALDGHSVGPFVPGMNVLYGPNESGKTSTAAFIGGVLFGWPDARANKNTYRPEGAERSGTLVFAPTDSSGEEVRCARARNAEGIKPEPNPSVLADIDRDTFKTIFALNSDELRSMGSTSDVTARLLTAGSGTQVSPASAADHINSDIAAVFSRATAFPDSVPHLQEQLAQAQQDIAEVAREAEELEREDREYVRLGQEKARITESVSQLNEKIRLVTAERERIAHAQQRMESIDEELAKLDEQQVELDRDRRLLEEKRAPRYLSIDAVEERTLRETIEDAAEKQRRLEDSLSVAKHELLSSQANLAILQDQGDERLSKSHQRRKHIAQYTLSIVLPVLFAVLGMFAFLRGRAMDSLSITTLGATLILFALLMAGAALVMLLRPTSVEERVGKQLSDAQTIVQKDQLRVEACKEAIEQHVQETAALLAEAGLGEARGNLRRARALLDEASDIRADATVLDQRALALDSQREQFEREWAHAKQERHQASANIGAQHDISLEELDERLASSIEQRDDLLHRAEQATERYGEIGQILAAARTAKDFDEAKLARAQIKTRYNDTLENLTRLLLAKRMLESAIAAWEGKRQPKVYRKASELLTDVTSGAWIQVRLTCADELVVVDAKGNTRTPELLSLGTLQQLYLCLRIALLLCADNVGRSIPVLADDILVNFDATRRQGAARALALLARERQVILLTCHEDVVDVMLQADSSANIIRL